MTPESSPETPPDPPAAVTRIARRRAIPGHEREYEQLVREMFTLMKKHPGFRGAELIPPGADDRDHQVVVNFASEAELAAWDASRDRAEIFTRMREHAQGDPVHRRLSAMDAWFEGPLVPLGVRPARWRVAVVTWLGIWPLASLAIAFLSPVLSGAGLPFLLVTAISTMCIVAAMTWLVAPALTNLLHGFLNPRG